MNPTILAQLFPTPLPTIADLEKQYPPRELRPEQLVTRIAPSPTGFMHIGTLYTTLISERIAHQTQGVFFLRLEDTDQKREVEGADRLIVDSLHQYGIVFDEGPVIEGPEKGSYGPYTQSQRGDIYKAYVRELLEKGLAYPCFCSAEELETIRTTQESMKMRPGYYGSWAKWRTMPEDQVLAELGKKTPFVIRFRSNGDFKNRKIRFQDLVKGHIQMAENDQDIVILKQDGLPTYHLAHVIDDHLMGTTHVTRGDEWLASVPLHLQLFAAMGWQPPQYAHLAPIQKIDGGSKRKLSKRKDPEASITYYSEQGYPKAAVLDYLLNLANSNFEDWRKQNLDKSYLEFQVTFEKLGTTSGALLDFVKLGNVSKEIISRWSADEVYTQSLAWANQYDEPLAQMLRKDPAYTRQIFNIERENTQKPRKDIGKWSDVRPEISYFYDELFQQTREAALQLLEGIKPEDIKSIVAAFQTSYDPQMSKDDWFANIKNITRSHGFADDMKEFRTSPDQFKGSIVDVTKIFRVLLTGRTNTPDLHQVMQVLGTERVMKRLSSL